MTPLDYLHAHEQDILDALIAFVQLPSVSTDPAYREGIARAAQWAAEQIRLAGPFDVEIIPTAGHPLVYGEWLGAPGKPTVIVYGHYDVQPPEPLDKWQTPPFAPEVREGRLYGRGVSDDKGPMLIPIKVAQAFFETRGGLPINVRFLFEGEEEVGSAHLETFIRDNPMRLAADFVLSADGAMWRIDEPSITVACRGMVGLEFALTTAAKDLHSGRYGGGINNALHAMAALVASLHAPDGRVAVTGFYDAVEAVSPDERAAMTTLGFDEMAWLAQIGGQAAFGEPGYTTLERLWTRPTLEVNGMWGGYQGAGSKTVIPAEAYAKITCRLVPHQHPDDIAEKLIAHLEAHRPPGAQLSITRDGYGALPYRIDPTHMGLKVAEAALIDVYGKKPLYVRMGGTIPVSEFFKRRLNLDTVFFSFSTADEDFHAPNEFFRLHRLREGLEAWARYWERLSDV